MIICWNRGQILSIWRQKSLLQWSKLDSFRVSISFVKDEYECEYGINWKDQIFSKQTQMFHEGRFLSQKKPACQAFSMLLAKRPPRVLLKQANTRLRKRNILFRQENFGPKFLLKVLNNIGSSFKTKFVKMTPKSPPQTNQHSAQEEKQNFCYGPETFASPRKVLIADWNLLWF